MQTLAALLIGTLCVACGSNSFNDASSAKGMPHKNGRGAVETNGAKDAGAGAQQAPTLGALPAGADVKLGSVAPTGAPVKGGGVSIEAVPVASEQETGTPTPESVAAAAQIAARAGKGGATGDVGLGQAEGGTGSDLLEGGTTGPTTSPVTAPDAPAAVAMSRPCLEKFYKLKSVQNSTRYFSHEVTDDIILDNDYYDQIQLNNASDKKVNVCIITKRAPLTLKFTGPAFGSIEVINEAEFVEANYYYYSGMDIEMQSPAEQVRIDSQYMKLKLSFDDSIKTLTLVHPKTDLVKVYSLRDYSFIGTDDDEELKQGSVEEILVVDPAKLGQAPTIEFHGGPGSFGCPGRTVAKDGFKFKCTAT